MKKYLLLAVSVLAVVAAFVAWTKYSEYKAVTGKINEALKPYSANMSILLSSIPDKKMSPTMKFDHVVKAKESYDAAVLAFKMADNKQNEKRTFAVNEFLSASRDAIMLRGKFLLAVKRNQGASKAAEGLAKSSAARGPYSALTREAFDEISETVEKSYEEAVDSSQGLVSALERLLAARSACAGYVSSDALPDAAEIEAAITAQRSKHEGKNDGGPAN